MPEGYCTTEDVRRALRKADLPGDAAQDADIARDAIVPETRWLEKTLGRHFYAESGDAILGEASTITIPQSVKTRDDEHDLPSQAGEVIGAAEPDRRPTSTAGTVFGSTPSADVKQRIRLAGGDRSDEDIPTYTRLRLNRRDADAINELHVLNENGAYDDWVASSDYDGGVGTTNRGEDYWVRINNGGVSELYIDIHSLDDDIPSLSNGVYVDFGYGRAGIPRNVRRAVATRAAAKLTEDAAIEIPQNATIQSVEAKAEELRQEAERLLEVDE